MSSWYTPVRCESDSYCRGFQCSNTYCIDSSLKCDGVDNCLDYSDEIYCKNFMNWNNGSLTEEEIIAATKMSMMIIVIVIVVICVLCAICCFVAIYFIVRSVNRHNRHGTVPAAQQGFIIHPAPAQHSAGYTAQAPIQSYPMQSYPQQSSNVNTGIGYAAQYQYTQPIDIKPPPAYIQPSAP